ncbi:MAG: DUF4159 domain-containing protein [Deltaproteobacteria bacterium]|nr:DUF4159 domain-containing protein [Deltaproteobacteria bacterium]
MSDRDKVHDGLTRRAILRGGVAYAAVAAGTAALAGGSGVASGLGARSKVRLAQLRYGGGNSIPRPTGLMRLAWELDKRTSVDVAAKPIVLDLDSKELFRYPFLYLGGDQAFPLPPQATIAKLRRHLVFGGFLFIDSAEAQPRGAFDTSARALIRAIFPKDPLRPIPRKHVIYKSFYLLDRIVGRVATVSQIEGVARDGRMALVNTQNDLAGAWARDNFGQWSYSVYPGGARQRELAFRWGINVVMYALCLGYKADQVHIPFILKRRRWHVGP